MADGIQIPIDLKPISKQLEKTFANLNSQMKALERTTKDLNKGLQEFSGKAVVSNLNNLNRTLDQTDRNMQRLGDDVKRTNQQVAQSNRGIFETYEDIRQVILDTISAVQFLRKTVLPVAVAFLETSEGGARFTERLKNNILELRSVVKRSIGEIQDALFGLFTAKTRFGFLLSLLKLNRTLSDSFGDVVLQADRTRRAALGMSDSLDDSIGVLEGAIGALVLYSNRTRIATAATSAFRGVIKGTSLEMGLAGNAAKAFSNVSLAAGSSFKQFRIATAEIRTFRQSAQFVGDFLKKEFLLQMRLVGKTAAGLFANGLGVASQAMSRLGLQIPVVSGIKEFGKAFVGAAKETELFQKNIFGAIIRIQALGTGMILLGDILSRSDNAVVSFTGSIIELIGFALAPLALVVQKFLGTIGGYLQTVGTELVNVNVSAVASFQAGEDAVFIFTRTLNNLANAFPEVISGTSKWNETVERLVQSTGRAGSEVRIAAAEIASATADIGLTEQQMLKLLEASVDLAAVQGDDVVQSSIDLIQGMSGASQSLIKYGFHLNQASVQQKLLKKGLDVNFGSLSETEKVQARFNAFLGQYAKVQGIATDKASTFSGIQKTLKQRIAAANAAFGEGASAIEDYSVGQRTLISIIESINPFFFRAAGLVSALTGRFLQAVGIILQVAFALALLKTTIAAINTLLDAQTIQKAFLAPLPLIGKSLTDLIKLTGAQTVALGNFSGVMKTFASVTVASIKKILASLVGLQTATVTFSAIFRAALLKSLGLLKSVALFFVTNPIGIAISLITAAVLLAVKSFQELDNRTKLISKTFGAVGKALDFIVAKFSDGNSILGKFAKTAKNLFARVIGVGADIAAGAIFLLAKAISFLPASIIGKEAKAELVAAADAAAEFKKEIRLAGFDIRKFSNQTEEAGRKLATAFGKAKVKNIKELESALKRVQTSMKDVGKTQIEIINETQQTRLNIIAASLKAGLIKVQEAANLEKRVRLSAALEIAKEQEKIEEERLRKQKELIEAQRKSLTALASGDVSKIVQEIQLKIKAGAEFSGEDIAAIGTSAAKALSKGAEGAADVIAGVGGVIASAWVGPLGQVVTELIKILAKGKDEVRKFVSEFITAIPTILRNVVQGAFELVRQTIASVPQLLADVLAFVPDLVLETLSGLNSIIDDILVRIPEILAVLNEKLPETLTVLEGVLIQAIEGLVARLPELIDAWIPLLIQLQGPLTAVLTIAAIKFTIELRKQAPFIALEFAKAFVAQIPGIFITFRDELRNSVSILTDQWKVIVGQFFGVVEFFRKGIDKLVGIIEFLVEEIKSIGNRFGIDMANGGAVPRGFPNDSFPANLSTGENVLNEDLSSKLSNFLSQQSRGGMDAEVVSRLDRIATLLAQQSTININGREVFAVIREDLEDGRALS